MILLTKRTALPFSTCCRQTRQPRGMLLLGFALLSGWLLPAPCFAADQALPDELTLTVNVGAKASEVIDPNEGELEGNSYVRSNVVVVLHKRSVRSDNYRCFVWTDEGFKQIDPFPVSTYRGHVKDDPMIQVNGNIEPGGLLNLNFTENRSFIARIRRLKIDVPAGKCTPTMSAGNKVVPLSSLEHRPVPSLGGYLIPEVPMRRTQWIIQATKSYTEHSSFEKVVSQIEQRWNDADFVYARDMGTAWEIQNMVLVDSKSTRNPDFESFFPDKPYLGANIKSASVTGALVGHNQGKQRLSVRGAFLEARILLHESAHVYGNPLHQFGVADGLCGGGAYWEHYNVAILQESMKNLNETNYPGVIYGEAIPPHATYDFANTNKDTPVTINVLENDYDGNGDAITLKAVQEKSDKGGTVVIKDGKAIYTPAPGFVGQDKFTYTIVDSTGVANRLGQVKVDVRTDGLAAWFDFEDPEEELIEDRRKTAPTDPELHFYDLYDDRPAEQKLLYHFRNRGPYDGGRGVAHWIDYTPATGVHGKGILNTGLLRQATVRLGDLGDPGYGSLSASIWVLYPPGGRGRVLLTKGANPSVGLSGWAIHGGAVGGYFVFGGNTARMLEREAFRLTSGEPIESSKWYHLVMVMDREKKQLRAWVNNTEVKDPEGQPDIPEGVIEFHDTLNLFNGHGGKWWNGTAALVDEVKIYTSVLTEKEVAELYAEGKDAKVPALPASTKQ